MGFVYLMFFLKETGEFIGDSGLIYEALNSKKRC